MLTQTPPSLCLLDDGDTQAQLCGADGARIAGGAAADDDDVEGLDSHG